MTEEFQRVPDRISRKTLVRLVIAFVAVVSLLFAGSLLLGGPIGWYVGKPTPKIYVEQSLRAMEQIGYYAEGPTWDAAKREVLEKTQGAKTLEETRPALVQAAQVAGGPGSVFETLAGNDVEAKERPTPRLERVGNVTTVSLGERVGLTPQQEGFYAVDLAAHIKAQAPQTCGWVLDLRQASGGALVDTLGAFTPLLPAGPLLEVQTRHASREKLSRVGNDIEWGNVVKAKGPAMPQQFGPVVALVGSHTSGAAEGLALALERRPDTVVMGEKTKGKTGVTFTANLPERTLLAVVGGIVAAPGKAPATDGVVPSMAGDLTTAQQWIKQRCR